MRILEFTPVTDNRLGAWIDGETAHGQHGCRSIYGVNNITVSGYVENTSQIGLLYGSGGLTLTLRRFQTGSVEESTNAMLQTVAMLDVHKNSLWTNYTHILTIGNTQEIKVLQQSYAMRHL